MKRGHSFCVTWNWLRPVYTHPDIFENGYFVFLRIRLPSTCGWRFWYLRMDRQIRFENATCGRRFFGNFAYFGIFFPRQISPAFSETTPWWLMRSYPFTPKIQKYSISEVGRNGSIIIFHLSKLRKAKLFILCDEISLVRLQEKYEIYNSCFFFRSGLRG